MDSGNAHLAAMLGLKVITIWGVTHPYAGFAPFNQSEQFMLLSDRNKFPLIPTSVYGNKYPNDYAEVARSISPERIIKTVESVI
jgi:ADP-heptose:LPS heptosyltransferase